MTPIDQPTPAQLAEFDQIHAKYIRAIDKLVESHRDIIAEYGDREVHTAALACYLRNKVSQSVCAELLATAIDHLTVVKEGSTRV